MKKIKIYGAGGHSRVIMDLAECLGYTITKVYDDCPDYTNLSNDMNTSNLLVDKEAFFSGDEPLVMGIGDNPTRARLVNKITASYNILIHPSAVISKYAVIGNGTVVIAGGIVNAQTSIGRHVIINTGARVGHDNIVGDFAHISPNVCLTGHVEIGEGTHIGAGTTIIPKVKVGKWCIVGAGAVIIRDVPDFAVVVGNPGRVIKYIDKKTVEALGVL